MPVFYLLINVSFIVVVLSGNLTAVVSVLNTIIIETFGQKLIPILISLVRRGILHCRKKNF